MRPSKLEEDGGGWKRRWQAALWSRRREQKGNRRCCSGRGSGGKDGSIISEQGSRIVAHHQVLIAMHLSLLWVPLKAICLLPVPKVNDPNPHTKLLDDLLFRHKIEQDMIIRCRFIVYEAASSSLRGILRTLPVLPGLLPLPHLLVCICPIVIIDLVWSDIDGPRVVLHRLLVSTHIQVYNTSVTVIPFIPTVDLDSLGVVLDCLLVVIHIIVCIPSIVVIAIILIIEFDSFGVVLHCILVSLHIIVYIPPITVIFSIPTVDSDGFGEVLHRLLVVIHIKVCNPSSITRVSKIALEFQGLAVVLDGLLILSSVPLKHSDIIVGFRQILPFASHGDPLLIVLQCLLVVIQFIIAIVNPKYIQWLQGTVLPSQQVLLQGLLILHNIIQFISLTQMLLCPLSVESVSDPHVLQLPHLLLHHPLHLPNQSLNLRLALVNILLTQQICEVLPLKMLDVLLDRDAFDDPPCLPIQLGLQLVQLDLIYIHEIVQLPDQHIHPLSHGVEVLMVRGVLNA